MKATYPPLGFWNSEAPTINFINPGEFRIEPYLKMIGLNEHPLRDSFGCADRREILRRQENIKFFCNHPEMSELVDIIAHTKVQLPQESILFMISFSENDGASLVFWNNVQQFLDRIKSISEHETVPTDIQALADFLSEQNNTFRNKELDMIRTVIDRLSKSMLCGGIVTFSAKCYGDHFDHVFCGKEEFFGFKAFPHTNPPKFPELRNYDGDGKIRKFFFKKIDERRKREYQGKLRRWAKPLDMGWSSPRSVFSAVKKIVAESFFNNRSLAAGYGNLLTRKQGLSRNVELSIGYRLDSRGLTVQFLGIEPELEWVGNGFVPIESKEGWFTPKIVKKVEDINAKAFKMSRRIAAQSAALSQLLELVKLHAPELMGNGITVSSPEIASLIPKDHAIEVLRLDDELCGVYKESESLRVFVAEMFDNLKQVSDIAAVFRSRSQAWRLPLHFPEILDDSKHLVSFDEVVPISLIGRERSDGHGTMNPNDIMPICSLEPLAGNMLGLTGQNCGGKTVTEEEYAFLVFMAQSGFPILGGKGVSLNVKNTIGMVFVERGEGSMVELMMKKTGLVLEEALKHPRNGTLVILDELGSGTQEDRGAIIGEMVLNRLHEAGISVVFSTQITGLAQTAERKFGAKCFAFDRSHNIRPGIGAGNPEQIIKDLGYAKLLGLEN